MRNLWKCALGILVGCVVLAGNAGAQFKNGSQPTELNIPRASQRGTVTQRIGLTDITITCLARHSSQVGAVAGKPFVRFCAGALSDDRPYRVHWAANERYAVIPREPLARVFTSSMARIGEPRFPPALNSPMAPTRVCQARSRNRVRGR